MLAAAAAATTAVQIRSDAVDTRTDSAARAPRVCVVIIVVIVVVVVVVTVAEVFSFLLLFRPACVHLFYLFVFGRPVISISTIIP